MAHSLQKTYQRRRRDRLIKADLCVDCSKNPPAKGVVDRGRYKGHPFIRCEDCQAEKRGVEKAR